MPPKLLGISKNPRQGARQKQDIHIQRSILCALCKRGGVEYVYLIFVGPSYVFFINSLHMLLKGKGAFDMGNVITTLDLLPIGRVGKVKCLNADESVKRRFLDLGLIKDTEVEALQKSPAGDPIAYYIRGTVIALRLKEAAKIVVEM